MTYECVGQWTRALLPKRHGPLKLNRLVQDGLRLRHTYCTFWASSTDVLVKDPDGNGYPLPTYPVGFYPLRWEYGIKPKSMGM
jgi:hypothetical protein